MEKTLPRIISLLVIPCLAADPASAADLASARDRPWSRRADPTAFAAEALSLRELGARQHLLRRSSNVHPTTSQLLNLPAIAAPLTGALGRGRPTVIVTALTFGAIALAL